MVAVAVAGGETVAVADGAVTVFAGEQADKMNSPMRRMPDVLFMQNIDGISLLYHTQNRLGSLILLENSFGC